MYIRDQAAPIVVKADGLAAGKGVIVAASSDEACAAVDDMLVNKAFGAAGEASLGPKLHHSWSAKPRCCAQGRNLSRVWSDTHVVVGLGLLTSHLSSILAVKYGLQQSFTTSVTSDKQVFKGIWLHHISACSRSSGAAEATAICHVYTSLQQHSARCMAHGSWLYAGSNIVVEEFLHGEEASFFALLDGSTCLALASAQVPLTVPGLSKHATDT